MKGYVPRYHYLYGRHLLYSPSGAPTALSAGSYPSYDFSSPPHAPSDKGPQTVDGVIARGYFAPPRAEDETASINDKKSTAWLATIYWAGTVHGRRSSCSLSASSYKRIRDRARTDNNRDFFKNTPSNVSGCHSAFSIMDILSSPLDCRARFIGKYLHCL